MCFAVKRGTNLDEIALKLCDIQGRLFELSANQKYDSIKFIRVFMNSDVSRALDSKYNRMQWAGEEYLLEEVVDNAGNKVSVGGEVFSKDVLYWLATFIVIGITTAVRIAKRYTNKQKKRLIISNFTKKQGC